MKPPTIGSPVLYSLTNAEADRTNSARMWNHTRYGAPHRGGEIVAAIVVRVLEEEVVNLQIFLDGNDHIWQAAVEQSNEPSKGFWHWRPEDVKVDSDWRERNEALVAELEALRQAKHPRPHKP